MELNENLIPNHIVEKDNSKNEKFKRRGIATFMGISGISAVIAGFVSSHIAKKRSEEFLRKLGRQPKPLVPMESPYALAFKALALGTIWAVGGVSLIIFGVWKWYGAEDLEDLKRKLRSNIKKSPPTDERTEFDSLKDFMNYITERYKSEKSSKDT